MFPIWSHIFKAKQWEIPLSPAALQEEGVVDDDLDAKPQGAHAMVWQTKSSYQFDNVLVYCL